MKLFEFPDRSTYMQLSEKYNVIPICTEILADTETPVSLLKKIYKNRAPVFLFESVEGGERWGRYSFLGASAKYQIVVYKKFVEIIENGKSGKIPHNNKPLEVLKKYMAQFKAAEINSLPRFWGGLVGYFSYEMVSFFEDISNNCPDDTILADFIIPDEILIFDNIQNTLLFVEIVFIENNKNPEKEYDLAKNRLKTLIKATNKSIDIQPAESSTYKLTPVIDKDRYKAWVKKVKEYIKAGDIIQTVISQPFVCEPSPDLWSLYRAQRYINPSPYLYFMHLTDTALVGSSPETMVRLENGKANLRPIAGTRPRGKTEQEDIKLADELLADEKERAEHLMLVDLGRNDLGRIAETGSVQVTDLMIVERYSHVMHLVSNICCDIKENYDAWDLLSATFPAGTLSGAPKIRAMEIISELEKTPRGPYGGAVGYISFNGNMDLAITIRTACIKDNKLTVRAGAGIVADSDPESEYIETVNKAMSIEKALEIL